MLTFASGECLPYIRWSRARMLNVADLNSIQVVVCRGLLGIHGGLEQTVPSGQRLLCAQLVHSLRKPSDFCCRLHGLGLRGSAKRRSFCFPPAGVQQLKQLRSAAACWLKVSALKVRVSLAPLVLDPCTPQKTLCRN